MTYDVALRNKHNRIIPTPLTIHGMSYGVKVLDFAQQFVFGDKKLSIEETKRMGKKFHRLMVKYCQEKTGSKDYFGSDGEGVYFYEKGKLVHDADTYWATLRWLQVYITAMALECGIDFH